MKNSLIQKKWAEETRLIKQLSRDDLRSILTKGRYPNNNTFPPLYDLKPGYKYSKEKIEYLCPQSNKTPRKYTIPDERLYSNLVDSIVNCWDENDISGNFHDPKSIKDLILSNKKIVPTSATILKPRLAGLSLKLIYSTSVITWKEFTQYHLYEESIDYKYLLELDIKDFYSQIYVHSIPWALTGDRTACKGLCRNNGKAYKKLKASKIESSLMDLQDRQTNGIPIGPLASDLIGEILLCRVVKNIEKKLGRTCYIGVRFKDDFKILCKSKEDAEKILETIADELYGYGLYLNDSKTRISSDFSDLVLKQWFKKIIKLPAINYDLDNENPTDRELYSLENELFAVLITLKENIKPSDGNFWYEFSKRYSKYLKVIAQKYPDGKGRIVVWLIEQLKDYPAHTGAIIELLVSLISMRDSKYLKIIRKRIVRVSSQRNYDVCMIWLIYFIAEKYLSSKYKGDYFDDVLDDMKADIDKISNEDIKKESKNLLEYVRANRYAFKGIYPISKTFKTRWRLVASDYE